MFVIGFSAIRLTVVHNRTGQHHTRDLCTLHIRRSVRPQDSIAICSEAFKMSQKFIVAGEQKHQRFRN